LVDVVQKLRERNDVTDNSWIKTIADCRDPIVRIINDQGLPGTTSSNAPAVDIGSQSKAERLADRIGRNLFLYFAAKRIAVVLANPTNGQLGGLLQEPNCWDRNKYPERYKLICEKISQEFDRACGAKESGKKQFEELLNAIDDYKVLFESDHKGLKEFGALYMQPNFAEGNLKMPSKESQDSIRNSKLVPQSIKDLLNPSTDKAPALIPPTNSNPETGKPPPDINAPNRQVILVSRAQLKEGVEVALLKDLLPVYTGNALKKNGLTISIGDAPIGKELIEVQNQGYFSTSYLDNKNTNEIKIHKNGRVSIDRSEANRIKLNYELSGKTWVAFVVIDEKIGGDDKPVIESLEFKINSSEKGFLISGTLADWIRNVQTSDLSIKILLNKAADSITDISLQNTTILNLPDWPEPSRSGEILPFINVNGIDNSKIIDLRQRIQSLDDNLKKYLKRPLQASKTKKQKEKGAGIIDEGGKILQEWEQLLKDIAATAGRTYALKVLSKDVASFDVYKMTKEERNTIIQRWKKELPRFVSKTVEIINGDWEKAECNGDDRIKKEQIATESARFFTEIGKNIVANLKVFGLDYKFDPDVKITNLHNEIIPEWAEREFKSYKGLLIIVNTVPIPIEKRRKDFLDKITTLRVQTKKGRVLFEATRQN
jgi:hypothetical protein